VSDFRRFGYFLHPLPCCIFPDQRAKNRDLASFKRPKGDWEDAFVSALAAAKFCPEFILLLCPVSMGTLVGIAPSVPDRFYGPFSESLGFV
jgi:hypothetical protein